MNESDIKGFQALPLAIFDKDLAIIYKNHFFKAVANVRLKTKIDKIFSKEVLFKVLSIAQNESADMIECKDVLGYCAFFVLPLENGTNALIYLPSHYSSALSDGGKELISLIFKEMSNDGSNDKTAKIRKALNRNFKFIDEMLMQSVDTSKIIEVTQRSLRACAFLLGIRLSVNDLTEKGRFLHTDMRALANEILCLFGIVLAFYSEGTISLEAFASIKDLCVKFTCPTERESLDDSVYIERYVLLKTSQRTGHRYDIAFNEGTCECTLTIPLLNKLELYAQDDATALTLFEEAMQIGAIDASSLEK